MIRLCHRRSLPNRFAKLLYACLCVVGLFNLHDLLTPSHAAGLVTQSPQLFVSGDSWELPAGNWQPSIHDLALWYPRTDADRTADGNGTAPAWAYHKRGLLGTSRVIPLGIVGNPPTYVTINGGPPGMTVDNDPDSATYLTLTIPNSETYSGTIDLTIHEQGGATINKTWAYVTSNTASHFVFVDTSAGGGGTGTAASPFDSIADVLTTDDQDETYLGRQVILTGTTTLAGLAVEYNGVYVKINGHKPQVWIASTVGGHTFRGSATNNPSVTTDASAFDFDGGDGSDFVFAGHNWVNPRICYVNGSEFRNIFVDTASSDMEYGGFFFNDFDLDATQGTPGANSTAIFFANNEGYDGFVTFYGNNFHDGPFLGPITIYDTHHVWIGKNEMSGIESANGWFLKGGNHLEDYALYFNHGVTGNTGFFVRVQAIDFEGAGPFSRRRIEVMHNIWKSTLGGIGMSGAADFEFGISSKRNDWKITSGSHELDSSDLVTGSAVFDFDIGECTAGTECATDDGTTAGFSITRGDFQSSGLDDTTAEQTTPNCTHGAEICGSALFTAPNLLDVANDEVFEMRLAA